LAPAVRWNIVEPMGLVRGLFLTLLLAGCADEAEVPVAAPAVAPSALAPAHGGTLVTLGAHRAELRAHQSGEVFAYLTRLDAAPVTTPQSGLLTVTLTVDADHPQPVLLRWNATGERYQARLHEEPLEGPAEVRLMMAGEVERGATDRLPVDPALEDSGVAYAEAEAFTDDEESPPGEASGGGGRGGSGGGGGGIRARARRLFGL